jgi:hypothetical protein
MAKTAQTSPSVQINIQIERWPIERLIRKHHMNPTVPPRDCGT